jgi:hypothetical protein
VEFIIIFTLKTFVNIINATLISAVKNSIYFLDVCCLLSQVSVASSPMG